MRSVVPLFGDRSAGELSTVPIRGWSWRELGARAADLRDEVINAHDPRECDGCAALILQLWSERRLVVDEIARRRERTRVTRVKEPIW
jgi:hypothetical protein